MTFVVGLVIRGDGSDADAALKKTGAAVKQLGDEASKSGRKTAGAGAAQKKAAGDAEALARANRTAAASFTNLNTAAVTSESGLRSALRQGARIGQVLGPAGAGGALKSLGVGLLAVANPMNFIAAATITAGAALIGWLSGAGDAAKEAEDRLKALQDSVSSLDGVLGRIEAYDFDSKLDGMGAAAVEIRREFENILSVVEKVQAKALEAALDGLRDQSGLEGAIKSFNYQDNIAGRLGEAAPTIDVLGLKDIADARFALMAIRQIGGDTKADVLKSLDAVTEMLFLRGVLTGEVQAYLATIAEELGLEKEITAEVDKQAGIRAQARVNADGYLKERAGERGDSPRDVARRKGNQSAEADIAELRQQAELRNLITRHGEDSLQVAFARRDAEAAVYAQYVAQLSVSAGVKAEMLAAWEAANGIGASNMAHAIAAALGASRDLQIYLSESWDAAAGIGAADVSSGIVAALGPAAALAGRLWNAAEGLARLGAAQQKIAADGLIYSGRGGDPTTSNDLGRGRFVYTGPALDSSNNPVVSGSPGGAGGGGGAAARTEADAIGELIARLKGENEVARETDPVQRKLLELRKEMTGATGAQRAEVEALIRGNLAEADALDAVRDRMETVREIGRDAVGSILSGLREGATLGDIFVGVLDRIADKLADLASDQISAALFGSGGAGGGTGWLGEALSGLLFPNAKPKIAARAATGRVIDTPTLFGMGGGAVGLMAEAGAEAIMPLTHSFGGGVGAMIGGQETALPLARLASGKLGVDLGAVAQPFAMGGAFGDIAATQAPASWRQAMAAGRGGAAPATIILTPTIVNTTGRPMQMEVEETVDARGQRQQRYIVSDLTGQGLTTPGGAGRRALRQQFGLGPQARSRG